MTFPVTPADGRPPPGGVGTLAAVDRLSLFKVLADGSRFAIYQQLASADEPLPTTEISRRLKLHPNTVRLHLEKMRDAGLVEAEPDRHGSVGRPQYRWRACRSAKEAAVAEAPELALEGGGFRLLAHLLAELAAGGGGSAADVGRTAGFRRYRARAAGGAPAGLGGPAGRASACVQAFIDELSTLGFDPVAEGRLVAENPHGGYAGEEDLERTVVAFSRCPFRELAVLYPDLVCELHRGLSDGIASAAGEDWGADLVLGSFSSLVDEDPCRAELTLGAR